MPLRPPADAMLRAAFVSCVLVSFTACRDAAPPTEAALRAPASAPQRSLVQLATDDTPSQLAVAQAVPGFGGYFIDEAGAPTVYLTDASHKAEAAQALKGFLDSFGWSAAD